MNTLILPIKRCYFDEIKSGQKLEEFRLTTEFWKKRIEFRDYDYVVVTLGYPSASDHERRLVMPYQGYTRKVITHPHFGDAPVEVFAIIVDASKAIKECAQAPDLDTRTIDMFDAV